MLFPLDLFAAGLAVAALMALLFVDAAYAMPLQHWRGKLSALGLYALMLLALAVVPDGGDPLDRLARTSLSILFALGAAFFALRRGPLDQVNNPRGLALVISAGYLLCGSLWFGQQDFGSAWSQIDFRYPGGQGAWIGLLLVHAGKLFDFLGAPVCTLVTAVAAGICLLKALRLFHVPDAKEVALVWRTAFDEVAMPPSQPGPVSAGPSETGRDPKHWWHHYATGDWRDPRPRALLRAYVRLGGPYFSGAGIPTKTGFLQLDRDVINRHLDGGSLTFHGATGRFGLTGRGYALLLAPE